jgi:putative zinc finger/helix-turn-helix YgiT family protein
MKKICPYCETQREIEVVEKIEKVNVRGESIEILASHYHCPVCRGDFEDPKNGFDFLEKAYEEYRRRHGMAQPPEIKAFRKRYGLTQGELSKLMGWGPVTLSRYENGALPDEVHDKMLRLSRNPENLMRLIDETPEAVPEGKRRRLLDELRKECELSLAPEKIFEERFIRYEPDEFSGYRRLDLTKFFNVVFYFCKDGDFKTKINKLLFYADFLHFKQYTVSITGARYARATFGPVPDKYETLLAALIENGSLASEEFTCSEEITGERLVALKNPDFTLFSDSEIKILATVREKFRGFSSRRIMEYSHNETGYKETVSGQFISYKYAGQMTDTLFKTTGQS